MKKKILLFFVLLIILIILSNKKILEYIFIKNISHWTEYQAELNISKFNLTEGILEINELKFRNKKDFFHKNIFESHQVIIDFKSGNLIANGQKAALCKFSNLDALKMENTEDAASDILEIEQKKTSILDGVSEYKEVEIIQLLESMKTQLEKIEAKLDVLNAQENENTVDDVTEVKEVEIIEATCEGGNEVVLFFIRNDGGTQYIDAFKENAEITFTEDKVLIRLESSGLMVMDFKSGDLFIGGEKQADCKFSNLEALR